MRWSKTKPSEPGKYWFFGQVYKFNGKFDNEPNFHYMEIWKLTNGVSLVYNGNFIYEKDIKGQWSKIIHPAPPADSI